jgi:hypothetical protein
MSNAMPCGRTNSPAPHVSKRWPPVSNTITGHWPRLNTYTRPSGATPTDVASRNDIPCGTAGQPITGS